MYGYQFHIAKVVIWAFMWIKWSILLEMYKKWVFCPVSIVFHCKKGTKQTTRLLPPLRPFPKADFMHGTSYWHTGAMVTVTNIGYFMNIKVTRQPGLWI